jgi:NADPH:quinone reductase
VTDVRAVVVDHDNPERPRLSRRSHGAATFDSGAFFRSGGARLYGLMLFHELRTAEPASEGLAILAGMIASGALRPRIEIEADWAELGAAARQLLDRSFVGKAVLYVR